MKLVVIAWVLTPSHTPPSVRAELVEAGARSLILLHACVKGGSRVVAPAGDSLSFASPKEKATPSLRPLRGAKGQTCVVSVTGCAVELALRCARRSDNHGESVDHACALRRACSPRNHPAAGAARWAWTADSQTATRATAALGPVFAGARAARCALGRAKQWPEWMSGFGFPSGCAEERRFWRIRARVCLSDAKRREFSETPAKLSTAGCPKRSAGTQRAGSPFLW